MMHLTVILEDTVMVATFDGKRWQGSCTDQLSGKSECIDWNMTEFVSVLALAMGVNEDNIPGFYGPALYDNARPAIKNWAKEVIPIP